MSVRNTLARTAGTSLALIASLLVILIGGVEAQKGGAQKNDALPAHYTANAINMDSTMRFNTTTVDLVINRWSTDADRDHLMADLVEAGQGRLLKGLQEMPKVGYIKTPDALSYDVHYARRTPGPDAPSGWCS